MLKKLPIGIQTLPEILNRDYLYIDKTEYIHHLLNTGKYFFLSRPRRFGKSLTLSTIKEIYSGNRVLFEGLWISDQWDWNKVHPVIHLSISKVDYQGKGLEEALLKSLLTIASDYGLVLSEMTLKDTFAGLLEQLSRQSGNVVLLIDEYDKPLIDYLDDPAQAQTNQTILKTFYSIIKDSDPYIEFMLITGVSKFSKVSIFSDLNNLYDLTLDFRFAALTGYTQHELEHYFAPYMPSFEQRWSLSREQLLNKLRNHYNGYSWDAQTKVYNPFSVLSSFAAQDFRNFWFETGTPTFLLKLLRRDWLYKLDQLRVNEQAFSSYDIGHLEAIPILFQTGYLTIKARDVHGIYELGYPNAEVKESLLEYLISGLRQEQTALSAPVVVQLSEAFNGNDVEAVIDIIKSIFKKIPSHIFIKEAEAYYHSLIYLVFSYLGQYTEAEVNDSSGRIDCVVKTANHIYIIEFKLDQTAQVALKQIQTKGYADSYLSDPRQKILLGINFSSQSKTVDDWLQVVL